MALGNIELFMTYDYIIIGGGIVGVSTAWQLLQRCPDKKVLLLEKEAGFAHHQTGHNSGVIHAGVYYPPDSLKAKFCREGATATMTFCDDHGIAYEQCGKLLVATNDKEYQRMLALYWRCLDNQLDVVLLDAEQLKRKEPNVIGLGAIFVKQTGIVDYTEVTEKMAQVFVGLGGQVQLKTQVVGIEEKSDKVLLSVLEDGKKVKLNGRFVISCGGLMSDRLCGMMGLHTDYQIIPYRGEYFRLPPHHNQIVKHLIYPIPDPDLPFLGIHLTRMIDGSVTVGPNAVQGFKREGYERFNFSLSDTVQMLRFSGFWKVTAANLKTGLNELKNAWFKAGYLKQVQKYCPQVKLNDLQPYPAGVRAQAVSNDGKLIHDFLFIDTSRTLHVCNAPSPAATSAIPIGDYICQKVLGAANDA